MTLRFLGTSDTVIIGQNVPTSSITIPKLDVKIFPNPVKKFLNIKLEKGNYLLQMHDLSGKIILRKGIFNQTALDLSEFSEGIYLLNINDLNNKSNFNTKLYISN